MIFARFDQVRRAAPLRADLHDALVLARGGEHRLAFDDIDADGLLAVDIRAGFDRRDHVQRVPVIGRADQHDVEIFLLQHLAIIAVEARLLFRDLARRDDLRRVGKHLLIDVAERRTRELWAGSATMTWAFASENASITLFVMSRIFCFNAASSAGQVGGDLPSARPSLDR